MGVTELEERRRTRDAGEEPDGQGEPGAQAEGGEQPEAVAEPKPTPPMQIPIPGTESDIGTEFGGRQPEKSEIRLLGGKMPIEGSFPKGTVIDLHVRVKVTGVLGQDTVDAFGQEESTTRRHFARMISVRRAPAAP